MSEQNANLISNFFKVTDEYIALRDYLSSKLIVIKNTPLEIETKNLLADGEKKRSMMDTAYASIQNVLDSAGQTWDDVKNWINNSISLKGINQLGVLPAILIPTAIVSAVSAATITLNGWLDRGYEQKAKIEQYETLVKDGLSPMEAANVSNQLLATKAKMGILDKGLLLAGLALVGFFLYKRGK